MSLSATAQSDRTLISYKLHDLLSNSAAFGGETLLQKSCRTEKQREDEMKPPGHVRTTLQDLL
jgi:hypothetical protein